MFMLFEFMIFIENGGVDLGIFGLDDDYIYDDNSKDTRTQWRSVRCTWFVAVILIRVRDLGFVFKRLRKLHNALQLVGT